ncbi:PadR family transcriptional regulator [Nonomuraea soli]|uniref:DNA-binding PadR family transcriptional regulator n=1 Tax=Nonomuraea soli TaxID=1032476 RepID=A0A7W0CL66_9ACTN|nr:PadR family transcriptional regulator [Nonomuraea soli]MBA2893217.1 DNA-binding PadR family transcriptional regulator [Nonomuraea soli]
MSSTRLLILGTLLDEPLTGYRVRQTLELWGADSWANVAFGSIYHGLGRMAEEGLLEIVERGKAGKTVYGITQLGRLEFHRMLLTSWYEIQPIVDPFQVSLTFMDRLDRPELLGALRARIKQLELSVEMCKRAFGGKQAYGAPRHIDENLRLTVGMLENQLAWCLQAVKRVEDEELP